MDSVPADPSTKIGREIPSGKRLHDYGKSPILMGKTHYFYGHFQ
jgi:hypothetical protein